MRRPLALLILAACFAAYWSGAGAQGTGNQGTGSQGPNNQVINKKVDRIEITEAGIFRAETASVEYAPGTATRQRNILSETRLLVPTTRVEAKLGMHFGIRYRVVGRPNNVSVRLGSVTQYPAPGLKNPQDSRPQTRGEHFLFATIGQINYRGYVFERDWELVPGTWVLELWDGDRKLASQTFEIVKP